MPNGRNPNLNKATIITKIGSVAEFSALLQKNPGVIILKFGAAWCGPCKKIEPLVEDWFRYMPANVVCGKIDIDDSLELYSFLKNKRRINGVPAILCYERGNFNYIPNDMTAGADPEKTNDFFKRCLDRAVAISTELEGTPGSP